MASTTITPPAAAPAAPSAPSTPAPAPSSTPSGSTPTPAPAAPTTPTPAAPSTPFGETIEDKLTSALTNAREAVKKESEETPEPAPAEVTPAAETQPAEGAPTTEPETPAEPQTPEFSLEAAEALAPAQFAEKLKASPEAQKFFDDNPALKQQVFAALRRDTENREIRTIVPNVEAAKEMQRGANLYLDFDNVFLGAEDPNNAGSFVERMAREAMIIGDDGQPQRDANGSYVLHPALGNILNHIYRTQAEYSIGQYAKSGQMTEALAGVIGKAADAIMSRAKLSGDERAEEAARILKEFASPSSSAPEDLPEHLRAQADSIKAERTALDNEKAAAARQRQEEAKVAHQSSIDRAEEAAAIGFQSQLKPVIAKAGLTPAETEWALTKIGNEIDAYLEKHEWFKRQVDSILRMPSGEAREKKHTALIQTYAEEKLGEIAVKVLREATAGAVKRQTDKQTKVDKQTAASAAEPRGASITMGQPGGKVSNAQLIAEYKASHNGDEPTLEWVLGEQMKRARTQPRA